MTCMIFDVLRTLRRKYRACADNKFQNLENELSHFILPVLYHCTLFVERVLSFCSIVKELTKSIWLPDYICVRPIYLVCGS